MKLELINPSDKIFFEAPNELIAWLTVILLGNGAYGAAEQEKTIVPVMIFGWRKYFQEKFKEEPEKLFSDNLSEIKKCLFTFKPAGEVSSLNDICKTANDLAEKL